MINYLRLKAHTLQQSLEDMVRILGDSAPAIRSDVMNYPADDSLVMMYTALEAHQRSSMRKTSSM